MAPPSPIGSADVVLERVTLEVGRGRAARTLLRNASHVFEPGSVTAVVGPSGAGKSTLLRAISGEIEPTGGNIRVSGMDVTAMSVKARTALRRKTVTTIAQSYNLVETLTAVENVELALQIAGVRKGVRETSLQWLKTLGLGDLADYLPDTLSGGEQQRVAIARSLAAPHPVVLADEPTGALDVESAATVVQLLRRFAEAGKCCIVATHNNAVATAADVVLALRDAGLRTDA